MAKKIYDHVQIFAHWVVRAHYVQNVLDRTRVHEDTKHLVNQRKRVCRLERNAKSCFESRPFCANCRIVDEHAYSMLNIHFRVENSFVLPKPYLAEVYTEHAHQFTTIGSIEKNVYLWKL